MNKRLALIGVLVVVLGIVASASLFTVQETQQALVLQFGEFKRQVRQPGLHVKWPFVQDVVYVEKRVLDVDPPGEQVILADQRRLDVDAFVRYRIVDQLRFFQTVRDEAGARARLGTITNASVRRVLGNATQLEVLSEQRAVIMGQIRDAVETEADNFGIQIVDVRIGRADVPEGTVQSVYDRMRSEREREAAEFRAQGQEQAQQIRARADRERIVLLAEAERQAQILRGQGDGEAIRIQAQAFSQDAQFFSFYRTLQAYRQSLRDDDTTLVLSPTGEFFRFFHNMEESGAAGTPSSGLMQGIQRGGPPETPPAPPTPGVSSAPAPQPRPGSPSPPVAPTAGSVVPAPATAGSVAPATAAAPSTTN